MNMIYRHLKICLTALLLFMTNQSKHGPILVGGVSPTVTPSNTDFIPCSDPCNGGDVNYELTAAIDTIKILNYTYRGRLFVKQDGEMGGFNEATSFMGPTMHVRPGQSLWIKFTNKLDSAKNDIGPRNPSAQDYWNMLKKPGEHIKYQYYKNSVSDPELMEVDHPNMPANFDSTNLHLHGLDVEVHMFDPVGTHNPDAPHIKIDPGECYCYKFKVPEHHPAGMYWYHPHLHGSTAVQMWGGLMGLLYVDGPLEKELNKFGVTNTKEFVIWDPAFQTVDNKETHNLEVDEFLMGQTTLSKIHPFLVNGEINPTFDDVFVGEVLHLRVLCGTVENENTFIVYPEGKETEDWNDAAIDFWVIGTDGVTFSEPRKKNIIVMSGGQRHEILLQFDKPGTYVISQQGIQGMQFFDMWGHPHDQILATVVVHESPQDHVAPTTEISKMRFTPGYSEDESIEAHEIVKSETIVFTMGANKNQAPFPQYYVNGQAFEPGRLDFFAQPGEAVEYLLVNGNHNVHPFHIHVNRFQVKEMGSELVGQYPVLEALLDYDDGNTWRDTVVVPPNGRARIWVKYKQYTGKTVFHCHFLAHEDTGMMSTLFIGPQDFLWYKWKDDNIEWLFGISLLFILLLLGVLTFVTRKRNTDSPTYIPVQTMNGLKSKTLD